MPVVVLLVKTPERLAVPPPINVPGLVGTVVTSVTGIPTRAATGRTHQRNAVQKTTQDADTEAAAWGRYVAVTILLNYIGAFRPTGRRRQSGRRKPTPELAPAWLSFHQLGFR